MNRSVLAFFCLLLAACSPAPIATPVSTQSLAAVETPTRLLSIVETPTASPTPSATQKPTETPAPPTITPLPAIPTFIPTFDVRTIITVTPAPKAECPQVDSKSNPDMSFLDFSHDYEKYQNAGKSILEFLNQFGPNHVVSALKQYRSVQGKDFDFQDVNDDGIPELVLTATSFYIFGCKDGKYAVLFEIPPDVYPIPGDALIAVKDINRDGIPEIIVMPTIMSLGGRFYQIYRWNGERFANLLKSPDPTSPDAVDAGTIWVEFSGKIHYEDVNGDNVQELVVDEGAPRWDDSFMAGFPWRNQRIIYSWNGQNYLPIKSEYDEPEYRFQAIQDGDSAVVNAEYTKALDFYQQIIFSDKLKAYSPEIGENLHENRLLFLTTDPTPTPVAPDPAEYPRLAAYAYYRMIILHTSLGEMDAAQIQYATSQEKFPVGNPGHSYVEMAAAFWDAYQSTSKMYNACAAAIAYADAHPEILTPLGSDYHGAQSHQYVPADVCPFR
jgi:hypothetical protein